MESLNLAIEGNPYWKYNLALGAIGILLAFVIHVTIKEMMHTGIWFNLPGVFLIMLLFTIINLFWWN